MKLFPGIYKRGDTYWFTRQTLGVRQFQSLHTKDFQEAIRRASELRGSMVFASAPMESLVEPFLKHKKSLDRYTAASIDSKGAILNKFARLVPHEPSRVTREMIQAFYNGLIEGGLACDTAASYLSTVRAFFRWCVEVQKICPRNPCAGLQLVRVSPAARDNFCRPELVRKLIAECPREDLRFILFAGFHAGMRKNEIIEARPFWFDIDARRIDLRKHDGIQFKDREERSVPMTDEFAAFLKTYGLRDPYLLHPEVTKGKSLYRYDFEHYFNAYMTAQGCQWVKTHIMRHTFASLLASNDVSIYKIAVWLGDDVRVVQKHYAKLLPVKMDVGAAFRV